MFVIGSARSGTVLLGSVLKRHSRVHCTIEHPLVFDLASLLARNPEQFEESEAVRALRRSYGQVWDQSLSSCWACASICRHMLGSGRGWLRSCAPRRPGRFADKSHQLILNVGLVRQAFPGAQFIHVIRDARDVVTSMLKHQGVLAWFSEEALDDVRKWPQPWYGLADPSALEEWRPWSLARKCARRWVSWVQAGLVAQRDWVPKEDWFEVRYEEFVIEPTHQAERLFSWLDLGFEMPTIAHVYESSVGRWKSRLDSDQIRDVIAEAHDLLEDLGYDV